MGGKNVNSDMKPMYILLISCFILLTASQCRKENAVIIAGPTSTEPVDSTRSFLALGDSYTIGQSVPAEQRFPFLSANILRNAGVNMGYPVYIAATGWTTTNLNSAIVSQQPRGPFDIVTLLIGVNDQYQTQDTTGYRLRFRNLLVTAVGLAGGKRNHVFVLSIPDYSVTPFAAGFDTAGIRKQIEWFNAINSQVTVQESCHYLDITPSTRQAAFDPALLAPDGLHPSGVEYAKWASRLAPVMLPVLQ